MRYTTDAGREAYFSAAAERGVEPGEWLEHARTTNLGIWGSAAALEADCAAIAAEEVFALTGQRPDPERIMDSPVFRDAYGRMRAIADARLHGELAELLPASSDGGTHPILDALLPDAVHAAPDHCGFEDHINTAALNAMLAADLGLSVTRPPAPGHR